MPRGAPQAATLAGKRAGAKQEGGAGRGDDEGDGNASK